MPTSKDLKDLDSKLKKTVISAESFKRASSFNSSKSIANIHKTISNLAGHVRKVVIRVGDLEKRVENNSKKITSLKNISALQGPQISGTNIGAKLPGGSVQSVDKNIATITESVSSIAEILAGRKKLTDNIAAYDRKKEEQEKRALAESKLEKRFDGLKRAAEKILSPVKSILDKIIEFLTTVLLGRAVYKLIEWWGDPKNEGKVKSIIRFLTDWGPALLGGFILFGTRFGKGVRILTRIALSGIAKLAKSIPVLLRFARGNPKTALAVAAGTYAATQLAGRAFSGGDEKSQGLVGGGYVIPRFSGGGLNIGSLFSGAGNFFNGFVSGERGIDKIPAMLTHGEFVMSAGAVQKYGVDTLEAMNAAGGGTNKPKMMSGTVYAQGGGYVGDIPYMGQASERSMQNLANSMSRKVGMSADELYRSFKTSGVPNFERILGTAEYNKVMGGVYSADSVNENAILKKIHDIVKGPQSFTQSSRAAAGLDDLAKKFDMDAKTAPRYAENLPRLGRPKPRVTRIDPRRMLPAAGESSANAMRAAARAAQNVRPPIPATSAIVPYTGGGLARTGVTAGLSVPQIRTNMRVPGGFGNLKSLGAELLLSYLMQSGLDYLEAKRLASSIEKARKESPQKLANRIEKLRELVDKEERFQKSFGGILQKVIKLGGETGSEVLSRQAKTILSGLGAKTFQGGAIKSGYGLKDQSFKDAPKTQIMTDDRGRPFVGYKAMRSGKLVYVRGPQPGMGTSNPLEMLGRAINPGAYKDVDAANQRRKFQEASAGSISSLRARGATAATIAKRQAELNKRKPIKPPVKPKPNYVPAGGGMGGARGTRKSSSTRVPSFSARNPSGMRSKIETLGMMR